MIWILIAIVKDIIVRIPITFAASGALLAGFYGLSVAADNVFSQKLKDRLAVWLGDLATGQTQQKWQEAVESRF
jgi:hypothetical protein